MKDKNSKDKTSKDKNNKYYKHYTYHVNWMTYSKQHQSSNQHKMQNQGLKYNNSLDIPTVKTFESFKESLQDKPKKQENNQWIIIDASSIIFRYFYANIDPNGKNINNYSAINGFCKIVLNFLHSSVLQGQVVVVFDGAKKNFKKNFNGAYKGKRKALPEELKNQLLLAEEFCIQSKIFFDKHILYEADDLIASYATQLPGTIYIVAYDKDFFQLINNRIFLWDYRKNLKIDTQWIFEKYGLYPDKMVDFWCLVGDMSDNLNGVYGIGKQRATKLLKDYGSLEEIIKSPLGAKHDFQTAMKLRRIITLKTDIIIKSFQTQDYVDFVKMNEFLRRLNNNGGLFA